MPNPDNKIVLLFDSYSLVSKGSRKMMIKDKKNPIIKPTRIFFLMLDTKGNCCLKKGISLENNV